MEYGFNRWEPPQIKRGHLNLGGTSPAGEEIEVNSLYLTRAGKPWIGVMGEMHYCRCKRREWHDRLAKMKAGGITVISTYVIWLYHEEEEGKIDFTGDNDLRAFILECQKLDLDVVVRIGPWCHGECRNGGFPDWLLEKEYKLRENNQPYLERVKVWFGQIAWQLEGLFYRDGGNIIGVQLENELVSDAEHLESLKEIAVECGMAVPLFTVTGWNSVNGAKIPVEEVLPVFGGYCDAPWEESTETRQSSIHYFFNRKRNDTGIGNDLHWNPKNGDGWVLPYEDYPFATCELGGGLQSTHHRRYQIQGMDIYAVSLNKLGDGNNLVGYYMYCGGTNKIGKHSTFQESAITGYANDYPILSYDFQAPVSEYGEIREQYRLLNLMHLFVQDFGELVAPMTAVDAEHSLDRQDTSSLRYGMRTDGKRGFVFINHYQRLSKLEDVYDVVIDTGSVRFPAIDVCGDVCFFMPFHMDLNGVDLEYGTAQPVCRCGNTYFFAEIPGIKARYRIQGKEYIAGAGMDQVLRIGKIWDTAEISLVTLTWDEARFLRRLNHKIYVGRNCDLYADGDNILSASPGTYRYGVWDSEKQCFQIHEIIKEYEKPSVILEDAEKPEYDLPYLYELNIGGGRKNTWLKLSVTSRDGMAEIEVPPCDVMQLYVDGKLAADDYYCGKPWRVPAGMLYEKECYLAYSELRNDCYMEKR